MKSYRLAFAGICLGAAVLCGQEFRATLTGRVVDPSDAPVPEAAVAVQNIGTNVTFNAKSDSHGNYTAILLPPGSYSVTITAKGFKTARRAPLQLTVAETSTVDFKLELGGLNQ